MYNYLEDKNLNEVYDYLKANNMYEDFVKDIVEENENYKKMLRNTKVFKKIQETTEKNQKQDVIKRNEKQKDGQQYTKNA